MLDKISVNIMSVILVGLKNEVIIHTLAYYVF